ncbi:fucose-binding lectin II [Kitasatospora sp. NPDC096077]|uniref:fucose-binding lectin II n=1 Tax=Kitasatospora sp. NPDC096077 TaxID=3155544 RepID=UPI00332B5D02
MSDAFSPWTLYLPFATKVYVYGFTNAAYQQRIRVTFENGTVQTLTGQGEGNRATSPASFDYTTPSTGSHLNGYQVVVDISYSKDGSTWTASQVAGAGCSLGWTAATYLVASEDWIDVDWNDAVVQFLWYNPPPVRNAALSARKKLLEGG